MSESAATSGSGMLGHGEALANSIMQASSDTKSAKQEGKQSAPLQEEGAKPEATDEQSTDKQESAEPEPSEEGWKVGHKVYTEPKDLHKEANRLMGRNSMLAHDLKEASAKSDHFAQQTQQLESALKEAVRINQSWQQWAQSAQAGNVQQMPSAPNIDEIVNSAIERTFGSLKQAQETAAWEQGARTEIESIQALPSYQVNPDLQEMFYKLSDKKNPETDEFFTPREAYEYAVARLGLPNELSTKPKPKQPPKQAVSPALAQRAARPNPSMAGNTKQKGPDDISLMLGQGAFLHR